MDENQIKHMVERFLAWKLPQNFNPDGGISFEPIGSRGTQYEFKREPSGTNLLDGTQAKAMVLHMLEGLPDATRQAERIAELERALADETEACARVAEDAIFCRCCYAVFVTSDGHPKPECTRPDWDAATGIEIAAAIRSRAVLSASDTRTPTVIDEIAAERRRQIDVEGWTPEHDDLHSAGDLACAAGCYALHAGQSKAGRAAEGYAPADWPWDPEWWKPKDPRRDLIRAAALIVAGIERLDRAASDTTEASHD
jgi:hypothetical protein